MIKTQQKIKKLVIDYKQTFTDEYIKVCKQIKSIKKAQDNHGNFKKVRELPETLYYIFLEGLTKEELKYFNSTEGVEWFCKTFKEFSIK